MKRTIKKVFISFLAVCMLLGASSVTAFANTVDLTENNGSGTTTVEFTKASSWTANIPAYINPSEQGNADTDKYSVVLSDVMLSNSATLVGTVEYDGKLADSNNVELGYVLCDDDGEVISSKEIIFADAGDPNAATSYNFGAELNENPKYAGNYLGTATFNFVANERVFTIGETKPENVIAKFNEDYSQVDIFTAGNNSDGIMRNFNGNSPMQKQALNLQTATIDDGVTTIGSQAFNKCENLESITIPNTITSIANDSFKECKALNTVYGNKGSIAADWAKSNSVDFVSIDKVYTMEDIENDNHLFAIGETKPEYVVAKCNDDYSEITIFANGNDSDGIMKYTSTDSPMQIHSKTLKKAYIESDVTNICDYAFSGCSVLENITIPESVTYIGKNAFSDCSLLNNITLPKGITSIENSAFSYCKTLETLTIPKGVTSIGNYAFDQCFALKNVTIPESVISIGDYAFNDCVALQNVTIPEGVTSIGKYAFYGCFSLESITIPEGVTSINTNIIQNCRDLKSITIPSSVTSIIGKEFSLCSNLKTIFGHSGSYAEEWVKTTAKTKGYTFVSIV